MGLGPDEKSVIGGPTLHQNCMVDIVRQVLPNNTASRAHMKLNNKIKSNTLCNKDNDKERLQY